MASSAVGMAMESTKGLTVLLVLLVTLLGRTVAQEDDFSSPIKCFTCSGHSEDSECSDPLDVKQMNTTYRSCESGVCLKYTVYEGHKLQMIRGCSADLNFHLTMIDGVCRTERNGNGYLCMCGKNLCNGAGKPGNAPLRYRAVLLLTVFLVLLMAGDSWSSMSRDFLGFSGIGNLVFRVR